MVDEETFDTCGTCRANRGELQAPGGIIYDDKLWRLEHALEPVPLVGWLVLKPLRHIESVAEMTLAESAAFGPLMRRVCHALADELAPAKVYVCSFGEADSFAHIHFHFIPRFADTPSELRGPRIFDYHRIARDTGSTSALVREAEHLSESIKLRLQHMTDSD